MAFNIRIDENHELVYAQISGKPTIEEHESARKQIAKHLVDKGYKKVIVDLQDISLEWSGSKVLQIYDFGKTYQEAGFPFTTRIAHILPVESHTRENVTFLTTVAANRGVIVKNFDNHDDALSWLSTT